MIKNRIILLITYLLLYNISYSARHLKQNHMVRINNAAASSVPGAVNVNNIQNRNQIQALPGFSTAQSLDPNFLNQPNHNQPAIINGVQVAFDNTQHHAANSPVVQNTASVILPMVPTNQNNPIVTNSLSQIAVPLNQVSSPVQNQILMPVNNNPLNQVSSPVQINQVSSPVQNQILMPVNNNPLNNNNFVSQIAVPLNQVGVVLH